VRRHDPGSPRGGRRPLRGSGVWRRRSAWKALHEGGPGRAGRARGGPLRRHHSRTWERDRDGRPRRGLAATLPVFVKPARPQRARHQPGGVDRGPRGRGRGRPGERPRCGREGCPPEIECGVSRSGRCSSRTAPPGEVVMHTDDFTTSRPSTTPPGLPHGVPGRRRSRRGRRGAALAVGHRGARCEGGTVDFFVDGGHAVVYEVNTMRASRRSPCSRSCGPGAGELPRPRDETVVLAIERPTDYAERSGDVGWREAETCRRDFAGPPKPRPTSTWSGCSVTAAAGTDVLDGRGAS
jgi:hypothetical protein